MHQVRDYHSENYGQSAYNIPQLFVSSNVYDLPFGRGKSMLSHGPLSWTLGDPTASCTVNGAPVRAGTERAYLNPATFAISSGTFGNLGRAVSRADPFFNMDFSLVKNIPITEATSVQLRFESFNTFNFQILGTPNVTVVHNTGFGAVQRIASTWRELQIGAKITF